LNKTVAEFIFAFKISKPYRFRTLYNFGALILTFSAIFLASLTFNYTPVYKEFCGGVIEMSSETREK
jgi:hypothetical protein